MAILILIGSIISFLAFRVFYFLGLPVPEVIAKGITSEFFVFYAFYCFFKNQDKSIAFTRYGIKMLCGLSLAVIADIAINLHIPAGISVFLVMQIFYILAYQEFKPFSFKNFALTVVMSIVFLAGDQLSPFFNLKTLFLPIAIYTFFLAGAAIKSLDAILLPNKRARIVPAASLIFLASDFVLQFTLGDICDLPFAADQVVNNVCHVLYYAAQFMLAHSLSEDFIEE
ncbi:YhhN-like protein [Treponema sp. JC4]|uniref:lysoplasmalogenase family protein n=1 Tax=Treponema sp. JC4 TaxID=1124982 RepID=UPI00025B047C|nr:lysoplasmalogenase family protein [Treponema sp. JC4]EID85882.1 YhhN-like protein [Treponema sp. JC4]